MTAESKKTGVGLTRLSIGWMFASIACGCAGTSEVHPQGNSAPAVDDLQTIQPATTPDTVTATSIETGYGDGWIHCDFMKLGVDESGGDLGHVEDYHPGKISAMLEANPEYQVASGLSQVTSCEEARLYTQSVAEYNFAHPDFQPQLGTLQTMYEDWLAAVGTAPAGVVDESATNSDEEVSKIYLGSNDTSEVVFQFQTIMAVNDDDDATPFQVEFCSAVRISDTLFLTSAHCVPPDKDPVTKNGKKTYPPTYTSAVVRSPTGTALRADNDGYVGISTKRHPNYMGEGNFVWDVGLIYIRKTWQSYFGTAKPAAKIASRTPELYSWKDVYGFGPTSKAPTIPAGAQTQNHATGYLDALGAGSNEEDFDLNLTNIRICKGDSGGGAFTQFPLVLLTGITAGFSFPKSKPDIGSVCAPDSTIFQHWSSLHRKIEGFIMPQMKVVQSLETKTPFKCRYHDGVTGSTTKTNVQDPSSYYDCTKK